MFYRSLLLILYDILYVPYIRTIFRKFLVCFFFFNVLRSLLLIFTYNKYPDDCLVFFFRCCCSILALLIKSYVYDLASSSLSSSSSSFRCVVSRKGEAVDMSTDHKPEDDIELTRIEKAGGAVLDGRVQVSQSVLWTAQQ